MKILNFIILLILLSCNNSPDYVYNRDFSLICKYRFDVIDLKKQIIKREYLDGEKTIHFELSEIDKKYLFNFLIDKKIWKITDDDLEDTCDTWIEPSKSISLKISMTTIDNYAFYWHESQCSIREIDDLNEFVEVLYNVIKKDARIRNLEETDILMM